MKSVNTERAERMVESLGDEWDSYVILCSRYEDGQTLAFRSTDGNIFAIQKMLEDELDNYLGCGGYHAEGNDIESGEEFKET